MKSIQSVVVLLLCTVLWNDCEALFKWPLIKKHFMLCSKSLALCNVVRLSVWQTTHCLCMRLVALKIMIRFQAQEQVAWSVLSVTFSSFMLILFSSVWQLHTVPCQPSTGFVSGIKHLYVLNLSLMKKEQKTEENIPKKRQKENLAV